MKPSFLHRNIVFVAGTMMLGLSLVFSTFSVIKVLSAPLAVPAIQIPNQVGFEGYIADGSGPIADGSYSITFTVYDAAIGGSSKWYDTLSSVQVTGGLYSVQLGSTNNPFLADTFTGDRWIGVTVVGHGTEITPRTKVSSVPYALNADSANKLAGAAGLIALFDTACPPGWSEVTSTRGRVVVGMPAGGTVSATVGTALGNTMTRTVTLSIAQLPSHTHTVDPVPITVTTSLDGAHTHAMSFYDSASTGNYPYSRAATTFRANVSTSSAGAHTHTVVVDVPNTTSSAVGGGGAVDVTMPYIQLVYCRLNP